jgi:hypothetical protein
LHARQRQSSATESQANLAIQGADFELRHYWVLLYLNEYEFEHKNDLSKQPNRSVWSKKD